MCIYDNPPVRDVRKSIFKHQLWVPHVQCVNNRRRQATSTGCVCRCTTNSQSNHVAVHVNIYLADQCGQTGASIPERCHETNGYSGVPAGLPTSSVTDLAVKTASSVDVAASQLTAMASTGIWPFYLAVTVAIPTAPSVAPVQTVNRAGSAVVRDGESAASSVAAAPVTPAATVDFHAHQPTASFVDQQASSVAIRAPKRVLPLRTAYFRLLNVRSVGNKSSAIACTIDEGCYDKFLLNGTRPVKTWLFDAVYHQVTCAWTYHDLQLLK